MKNEPFFSGESKREREESEREGKGNSNAVNVFQANGSWCLVRQSCWG